MLSAVVLSLAILGGGITRTDTVPPAPPVTDVVGSHPVGAPSERGSVQPVELSDWYYRRNTIHHVASYTMIPLFTAQYVSGRRVYEDLANAPLWATRTHQVAATGVAVLFLVNTVTGVWNLWEGRAVKENRARRLAHSALMLAADAGFAYTGLLAERAEADDGGNARRLHRTVALTSVGVSAAGYLVMLVRNR